MTRRPFFQRSIKRFNTTTGDDGVVYIRSAVLSCGHVLKYSRRATWPSKRTAAPCYPCGSGLRYLRKNETVSACVPARLSGAARPIEHKELDILRRIEEARPSTQYARQNEARQIEARDVTWRPRAVWAAMHGTPAQREAVRVIVLLALEQAATLPRDPAEERRNELVYAQAQIAGILDRPKIDAKDRD